MQGAAGAYPVEAAIIDSMAIQGTLGVVSADIIRVLHQHLQHGHCRSQGDEVPGMTDWWVSTILSASIQQVIDRQ